MFDRHPDRKLLERFLGGDLTDDAGLALQRHLFVCAVCEQRLIDLLPEPAPSHEEYHHLIGRLLDSDRVALSRQGDLSRERSAAAALWRDLEPHDVASRRRLVRQNPRYQTWGVFELLVERSRAAVLADARTAEDLLRLALEVAERLDPAEHGPGSTEAARCRTWTHLGDALRVQEDFAGAEEAFQAAELFLTRSWLDPLDEALVLEFKARLRRAQRRFDEALELIDGAIAIHREIHEPHLEGRALMVKGLTLQYLGDPAAAADCFRTSLSVLDEGEEPRLAALARFNLVGCLQDAGRSREAAALLAETRREMEQVCQPADLVRLRWTEAKVAASLGRSAEAEQAFLEVRAGFLQNALAYDAALISLDLAALYLRQGRAEATKLLAAEILPVFRSREVYREALAALIVFQNAAELEQLTLGLVDEIAAYLRQARHDPGLRFRTAT